LRRTSASPQSPLHAVFFLLPQTRDFSFSSVFFRLRFGRPQGNNLSLSFFLPSIPPSLFLGSIPSCVSSWNPLASFPRNFPITASFFLPPPVFPDLFLPIISTIWLWRVFFSLFSLAPSVCLPVPGSHYSIFFRPAPKIAFFSTAPSGFCFSLLPAGWPETFLFCSRSPFLSSLPHFFSQSLYPHSFRFAPYFPRHFFWTQFFVFTPLFSPRIFSNPAQTPERPPFPSAAPTRLPFWCPGKLPPRLFSTPPHWFYLLPLALPPCHNFPSPLPPNTLSWPFTRPPQLFPPPFPPLYVDSFPPAPLFFSLRLGTPIPPTAAFFFPWFPFYYCGSFRLFERCWLPAHFFVFALFSPALHWGSSFFSDSLYFWQTLPPPSPHNSATSPTSFFLEQTLFFLGMWPNNHPI